MQKHYIVLAHRGPEQLSRLVRQLDDGESTIWLHVDGRVALDTFADVTRLPAVRLVHPRVAVTWGSFTVTKAILVSLRAVLASRCPGTVTLLSAQDFPVKGQGQIDAYLDEHGAVPHIDLGPIEEIWPEHHTGKVDFYCLPVGEGREDLRLFSSLSTMPPRELLGWARRIVRHHGLRHGLRHVRHMWRPRPAPPVPLYGGSMWWTLPWTVAGALLGYLDEHPALLSYLEYTQCSDEVIVQTVLAQLPTVDLGQIRPSTTWIDWSGFVDGSPRTLRGDDVPQLLSLPENRLFTRKFDLDRHPSTWLFELDRARVPCVVTG